MSEKTGKSDLCQHLQYLVGSGMLEDGQQRTGESLLTRLTSDIRVVLLGPEGAGKTYLHEVLTAQALPQTTVRIADLSSGFRFDDAEVCIWCTSGFGPEEAEQWRQAPDRLKDHSFLVAVAAPETAAARHAQAQLNALDDIAMEEFYGLFPIVIGAQVPDVRANAVQDLFSEVANLVQLGLAADADNAQMFLEIHQPENTPERPNIAVIPARTQRPLAPEPPPQPADAGMTKVCNAGTEIYRQAHSTLRDNAARLAPFTSASADAEFSQILEICQETSEEIVDVFSKTRLDNPEFCILKEEMLSAADKILLMSLEGGVAPAIAATTTILQIKRELEVQIAS